MIHAIAARFSRYEEKCFNCRVPNTYEAMLVSGHWLCV